MRIAAYCSNFICSLLLVACATPASTVVNSGDVTSQFDGKYSGSGITTSGGSCSNVPQKTFSIVGGKFSFVYNRFLTLRGILSNQGHMAASEMVINDSERVIPTSLEGSIKDGVASIKQLKTVLPALRLKILHATMTIRLLKYLRVERIGSYSGQSAPITSRIFAAASVTVTDGPPAAIIIRPRPS